MMFLVITVLLYGCAVIALFRRVYVAIPLTVLNIFHDLISPNLGDTAYYVAAGVVDVFAMIDLTKIRPIPKIIVQLHLICFVSILVNFAGWIIYMLWLPPEIYDAACVIVYMGLFIVLIQRGGCVDVGCYSVGSWFIGFWRNNYTRLCDLFKHEGAT